MPLTPQNPTNLQLQPTYPRLPESLEQVIEWIAKFDAAGSRSYRDLAQRLQVWISQSGDADFGAATTSVAVTFGGNEPDTSYIVLLEPSWNTTFWITSKATTGFTINVNAAAGIEATVPWVVVRL